MHQAVVRFRTGYPDGKLINRLVDKAHDERVIAMDIAPAVAKTLGLSANSTMSRAAEYRLRAMLFEANLATDADVRARVVAELRPMATVLGRDRLLDEFTAGSLTTVPARLRKLTKAASVIDAQMRNVGVQLIRPGRR